MTSAFAIMDRRAAFEFPCASFAVLCLTLVRSRRYDAALAEVRDHHEGEPMIARPKVLRPFFNHAAFVLAMLLVLLSVSIRANAQAVYGSIAGIITDSTGA